jgi:hypothetical protein
VFTAELNLFLAIALGLNVADDPGLFTLSVQ